MLDGRLIGLFLVLMLSNPEQAVGGNLARRLAVLEMVSVLCIAGSSFAVPSGSIEGPLRDGIGVLDVRLSGLLMVALSNPDLLPAVTDAFSRRLAAFEMVSDWYRLVVVPPINADLL